MKAINIEWDVDYEDDRELLPTEIDIPEGMTDEDEISDYISDVTGFCHFGYELTTIVSYVINSQYSLRSIVYPPKLTSIGINNAYNCYNIILHDFRNAESVPTLGTNCFYNVNPNMKIVVPDELYDTWIAATNWSAVASKIVKASEYTT